MIKQIKISDLFLLQDPVSLIDVRTPAEYQYGHIPGAVNLPIFSNEERIQVGTTYKHQGREQAILLGFDLTGPKWSGFIKLALVIAPGKRIAVHCWRGGMRSGAMAWALDLYGFEVLLVDGGYKAYRNWVLQQFQVNYDLRILGGMTGSGKTSILQHMSTRSEQVIDLEALAQHKGSSYGTMNKLVQPTQEQFENDLADQLAHMDHRQKIWIEDENISIGRRSIPIAFWQQMQQALLIEIEVDTGQRISSLVNEYGCLDKDFLVACTERIKKRVGTLQTKLAIEAIRSNDMHEFIRILLVYYDKSYRKCLALRSPLLVYLINISGNDTYSSADLILAFSNNIDSKQTT